MPDEQQQVVVTLKSDAKNLLIEQEFINCSKSRAQDLAEFKSLVFRLISIDGEPYFSYPEDIRTDRICIEVTNGRVSSARIQ